jgi:hypothetical protein
MMVLRFVVRRFAGLRFAAFEGFRAFFMPGS